MLNGKHIFKLIVVSQLLACTWATYGHPDAETIDFGSPTYPSRDQLIIEAAIKRGMDGEAVAELLRTKKPVVRTTTTPTGFTKTTTYKLESDGSISSKSILQKRNRYVYNSDSIPDELKNTPTRTITRTFTDSNGNKVTKTITVNQEKPLSGLDTDDLNDDWFSKNFGSWPEDKVVSSPFGAGHRTVTRTFTGPNGERRTVQSWSSDPEFPEPETPLTTIYNTPSRSRTTTATYVKPNREKPVVQTTTANPDSSNKPNKPKFPPIGDINWPSFDYPTFSQPWDIPEPDDTEGWEVLESPETTTKKKVESWTPKTWEWPTFPTRSTTTTTTVKPKLYIEPEPSTLKPLPNLEDFLKSQYGAAINREATTSTAKTNTQTPKSIATTTPQPTVTTPKIIKIEDLPVVEVLHNGKPAGENILKTLPRHLTPRTPAEPVINIEHKYPIDEDVEEYTPKVETNIRTYSKTHIGAEKPTLKDLDPQMQDILKKAGIVPEIEGDTITKTRKEPDGRVITTSYKVNTIPIEYAPTVQQTHIQPQVSTYSFNSYKPLVPLAPLTPHFSPISEFLAQLGLTKFDITSRNGHYSKTFIDENGDVLTATFVLSSAKGVNAEKSPSAKPLK